MGVRAPVTVVMDGDGHHRSADVHVVVPVSSHVGERPHVQRETQPHEEAGRRLAPRAGEHASL
jgi:hypothetical protein